MPIRATQPAAVGPPRLITTTRVAIDVLMIDPPRHLRPGVADARMVITVQNTIPAATSSATSSNHPEPDQLVDRNHKTRDGKRDRT